MSTIEHNVADYVISRDEASLDIFPTEGSAHSQVEVFLHTDHGKDTIIMNEWQW